MDPEIWRQLQEVGLISNRPGWFERHQTFVAIIVSALIGFTGVVSTLRTNARLARDRAEHDAELARVQSEENSRLAREQHEAEVKHAREQKEEERAHKRHSILTAIVIELNQNMEWIAGEANALRDEETSLPFDYIPLRKPAEDAYKAFVGSIGMLSASEVFLTMRSYFILRTHYDRCNLLLPRSGEHSPPEADPEGKWRRPSSDKVMLVFIGYCETTVAALKPLISKLEKTLPR